MKRRSFVGLLGVGTLSSFDLVQRAFTGGLPLSTAATFRPSRKAPARTSRTGMRSSSRFFRDKRILLNGDSISKGYAFGNYTDPSPLRTLYGMAEILMKDNLDRPAEWNNLPGVWEGIDPDGTPKTVDTLAERSRSMCARVICAAVTG